MHVFPRAALALAAAALSAPFPAHADTASDLQAMRDELSQLRANYEARIQALEARLKAAESGPPPVATAPSPVTPAAVATAPSAATPAARIGFNPQLSLILAGQYVRTSRDPVGFRIRGIPLPPDAEIGPGERGFSLAETELGLSANIDPWFRGVANIAFHGDDAVSVEEAFVETTSLGGGLTAKAGRFLSSIGYLNARHAHSWDFADAPLAYQALLGTQFASDGLQVAWLAPTDRFIELRAELGRGRGYPASGNPGNGASMAALSAHTGGDIGESHSWRAGLSFLRTRAADQALAAVDANGADIASTFTGRTRTWIADFVWKWAPGGNATRTNFKVQGEWLRSTRDGDVAIDPAGANTVGSWRAAQSGGYLQAVYQFMPRWRVGVRTERLDDGSPGYGIHAAALTADEGVARRQSVMVDWNPSEFSRVRLQLAQDRSRPGAADRQLWLQYQMSLGAHGAHSY